MILPVVVNYFFHDELAHVLANVHELRIHEAIIVLMRHLYLQTKILSHHIFTSVNSVFTLMVGLREPQL